MTERLSPMRFNVSSQMRFIYGSFLFRVTVAAEVTVAGRWRFCGRRFGRRIRGSQLMSCCTTQARLPFGGQSVTKIIYWGLRYLQTFSRVPNKSLEPTPIGHRSSAIAVHAA